MIINEFEYILKDGRRAIIRSPKEEDIDSMLEYLYKSASETDFVLRYPEECSRYTKENEKELFERINSSDNEVMLVCIVDGKVAGNCDISWNNRMKTKHRAFIGIALLKDYWNQGIGTRFFEEMIRIAENNENILQLELDFIEGNVRARALYEKMGFRITGVGVNAVRLKNGTLLNEYHMIKEIKR